MSYTLTVHRYGTPSSTDFPSAASAVSEAIRCIEWNEAIPFKITKGDVIIWELVDNASVLNKLDQLYSMLET